MNTIELNPLVPPPPAAGPASAAQERGVVRRMVDRVTYPAEHPFSILTLYYLLLILLGAGLVYFVPGARGMISGERLGQLLKGGSLLGPNPPSSTELSWSTTLDMGLAMLGAFALMMPTSWVYMAERRRKGFDQGMVQTMIVLSVAIAGVVVIVRNSTALAFSLTGIVAAVRFRNNLADTRDTLYIFTGIGVGLSAGVQALAAALVLSMIFNYITLLFWRADYGMCELGRKPGYLLVAAPANGKGDKADKSDKGDKKKAKKDFNAVVIVRVLDPDRARPVVDRLLEGEVSRFKLAEVEQNSRGQGVLKYVVRLGKQTDPRDLEDALLTRAAPAVIGARVH